MDNKWSDFDRAQLEFLRQRTAEVESEARQAFQTFGEMLGVESLTLEDVTPEIIERLQGAIGTWIRRTGNVALADRYLAAHTESWRTLKEQARFLRLQAERTFDRRRTPGKRRGGRSGG